jgi:hypothetical protein
MNTVVDGEGVTWTVSVAYEAADPTAAVEAAASTVRLAVLWFETANGRTASIRLPVRSVATLTNEDLLEMLAVALGR